MGIPGNVLYGFRGESGKTMEKRVIILREAEGKVAVFDSTGNFSFARAAAVRSDIVFSVQLIQMVHARINIGNPIQQKNAHIGIFLITGEQICLGNCFQSVPYYVPPVCQCKITNKIIRFSFIVYIAVSVIHAPLFPPFGIAGVYQQRPICFFIDEKSMFVQAAFIIRFKIMGRESHVAVGARGLPGFVRMMGCTEKMNSF